MPSYIKELRSLCTSLGLHAALPPLAEFAIDFSRKTKVTLVPPEFPAELERKEGLLCFQRKYILQETSDVNLMKKMKMFQVIISYSNPTFFDFGGLQKAPKMSTEGTSS